MLTPMLARQLMLTPMLATHSAAPRLPSPTMVVDDPTFQYAFMLPASTAVATSCQLAGIGGAALFSPIFLLIFPLLGPEYPLSSPAQAIASALLTEVFGFSSGLSGYARRGLVETEALDENIDDLSLLCLEVDRRCCLGTRCHLGLLPTKVVVHSILLKLLFSSCARWRLAARTYRPGPAPLRTDGARAGRLQSCCRRWCPTNDKVGGTQLRRRLLLSRTPSPRSSKTNGLRRNAFSGAVSSK